MKSFYIKQQKAFKESILKGFLNCMVTIQQGLLRNPNLSIITRSKIKQ